MSTFNTFLTNEMQKLSNEAKKKYPKIKEASERVIVLLRANATSTPNSAVDDLENSYDLLVPFSLSCETKNQKLIIMAIGCLQNLIMYNFIPKICIKDILKSFKDIINISPDIQVRVLQVILPLVSKFSEIKAQPMHDILEICFELSNNKSPDISNTASAILKQLIMIIFVRIENLPPKVKDIPNPNDTQKTDSVLKETDTVDENINDGLLILKDLCLLAERKNTEFLQNVTTNQGFALEIIESIIASHHKILLENSEFQDLVKSTMAPMLTRLYFIVASFKVDVRQTRVILLFIEKLNSYYSTECKAFLSIFIKLMISNHLPKLSSESEFIVDSNINFDASSPNNQNEYENQLEIPSYYRMLSAEAMLKIIGNINLFLDLYNQYDLKNSNGKIIYIIIKSLANFLIEKSEPWLYYNEFLSSQPKISSENGYSKTNKTRSNQNSPSIANTFATSGNNPERWKGNTKMELLDMVDKVDAPHVDGYLLFSITLSCILELSKGVANLVIPVVSQSVLVNNRDSNIALNSKRTLVLLNGMQKLDRIVDLNERKQATLIKSLLDDTWPELLASTNILIGTSIDEVDIMSAIASMETLTKVLGAVGIQKGYSAFIMALCKNSLPSFEISAHERQRRSVTTTLENSSEPKDSDKKQSQQLKNYQSQLSTEVLKPVEFSLSNSNVQSIRALSSCASFLSPILNEHWYLIVVTLQQAEELLFQNKLKVNSNLGDPNQPPISPEKVTGFDDKISNEMQRIFIDHQLVISEYDFLFELVPEIDGDAFGWFVRALCLLNSDLSGTPIRPYDAPTIQMMKNCLGLTKRLSTVLNRPVFSIKYMVSIANNNMKRLITARAPFANNDGEQSLWDIFVLQLLDTATYLYTPNVLRSQACEALSESVLSAMSCVLEIANESVTYETQNTADGLDKTNDTFYYGDAQMQALMPLSEMMSGATQGGYDASLYGKFTDVQKLALTTLNQLLQASGHTIKNAWSIVFDILQSAVLNTDTANPPINDSDLSAHLNEKTNISNKNANLLRWAFPSLQLVCSDFIGNLTPAYTRRCILVLGEYAKQTIEINIALTSVGLMWNITDYLLASGAEFQTLPTETQDLSQIVSIENQTKIENNQLSDELNSKILEFFTKDQLSMDSKKMWMYLKECEMGITLDRNNSQCLFLLVLHTLANLSTDDRHDMRSSSIQILFSALDLYGDHLSTLSWDVVIWAVINPLMEQVAIHRANSIAVDWVETGRVKCDGFNYSKNAQKKESSNQVEPISPDIQIMPEINKSGLYVEDSKIVRLKTWDETVITMLSKIAGIWTSKARNILINTSNPIEAAETVWSWICVIFSGSLNPQETYKDICKYIMNNLKDNSNKFDSDSEHRITKSDMIFETESEHENKLLFLDKKHIFLAFQSSSLIDSILTVFQTFLNFFKDESEASANQDNNQLNYFVKELNASSWRSWQILAHISSFSSDIDDNSTKAILGLYYVTGFTQSHFSRIVNFAPLLIQTLGPSRYNQLSLLDYEILLHSLKLLLFGERSLETRDINILSPVQNSVLETVSTLVDLFNTNNEFDEISNAKIGNLKSHSENALILCTAPCQSTIIPLCLDFLNKLASISLTRALCTNFESDKEFVYPENFPSWTVDYINSTIKWVGPLAIDFYTPQPEIHPSKDKNNDKSHTRLKWKPTYIALSQNSILSIKKVVSKLAITNYLEGDIIQAIDFRWFETSNVSHDHDSNKMETNETSLPSKQDYLDDKSLDFELFLSKADLNNNPGLELATLLYNITSKGILDSLIKSSALIPAFWDSLDWSVLEGEKRAKFDNNAQKYSCLRPSWNSSTETLLLSIQYAFETLSHISKLPVRKHAIKTWTLVNSILEGILFLSAPSLPGGEHKKDGSEFGESIQSHLGYEDWLDSADIPPQISCNYDFSDYSYADDYTWIIKCPPPASEQELVSEPHKVQNNKPLDIEGTLDLDSTFFKEIGHSGVGFYSKMLNITLSSALRFLSTITDLKLEEAYIYEVYQKCALVGENIKKSSSWNQNFQNEMYNTNEINSSNQFDVDIKDIKHTSKSDMADNLSKNISYQTNDEIKKDQDILSKGHSTLTSAYSCKDFKELMGILLRMVYKIAKTDSLSSHESSTVSSPMLLGSKKFSDVHIDSMANLDFEAETTEKPTLARGKHDNHHRNFTSANRSTDITFDIYINSDSETENSDTCSDDEGVNDLYGSEYKTKGINPELKPVCFGDFSHNEVNGILKANRTKLEVQTKNRGNICNYGRIPGFAERPPVCFWVSELASKLLVESSANLICNYLDLGSSCLCDYNDDSSRGSGDETNNFSFERDFQIVFLLSHFLFLNCRTKVFSRMIGFDECFSREKPINWFLRKALKDNPNLNQEWTEMLSCKYKEGSCWEENKSHNSREMFDSEISRGKDGPTNGDSQSFNKIESGLPKEKETGHKLQEQSDNGSNHAITKNDSETSAVALIKLCLLSGSQAHIYILFDFISIMTNKRSLVGRLAKLNADRIYKLLPE
ncbi:hypothetical protein BB558_001179 [Smittium angustum]|uniref:Protein MON2 homolog n=1 Tax=Smittium angustum TaxID=133377 RepID=A0A2U1JCD7_SMIAN|nr:hypothetical protein BB558_001179 [Smittium angustum]